MSLSGKIVTRVFQISLRNNLLNNCRQASCFYLSRQQALLRKNIFKSEPLIYKITVASANLATKNCHRPSRAMGALSPLDPSSNSRPEQAIIKHISLVLNVDFEKKVLNGDATLSLDVLEDIEDVPLDVSNLQIESIEVVGGPALQFKLGEHLPNYGSKLTVLLPNKVAHIGEETIVPEISQIKSPKKDTIPIISSESNINPNQVSSSQGATEDTNTKFLLSKVPSTKLLTDNPAVVQGNNPSVSSVNNIPDDETCPIVLEPGERLKIRIKYTTNPAASALQWLDPAQTSGKKHPYMFSQCQPIHARSILPCQDTPAVKFSYDAEVTAPEEFTVLMSALRGEVKNNKTYFSQPMPTPSYLVAIAVGVLESRTLGPRTKVWTEKEEIERSAWEFADTEKYLQAAEKLCGKYEWTQYDLLVLPPSFPYGGMENPCLTFVTPTLLAGDRSQATVLVHEIMHSWTGNLVTNRNFEHFWLNEGFTVFLERKVDASLVPDPVEAKRTRDFQSLLGLQELTETVKQLGENNSLTKLVVDLTGVHPDDAFSRIPYEKGSLFLRYLEDLVGGPEVFDEFLRSYLVRYKKQSIDTDNFRGYLNEYFKDNENLKKVDWDAWLKTSGMPPVIPDYDTTMTVAITNLVSKLEDPNATLSYEDVKNFSPHQMIHFLQQLIDKPPLPVDKLRVIGTEYKIAGNTNTEILYRWSRLCVKSKDESSLDDVFKFLNSNGRMKYVRPLYRELYAWEDVRKRTIDNFLKYESSMMHVSAYTIRKDLHLND